MPKPYHDDLHGMQQRRMRQQMERLFSRGQTMVMMLLPDTCTIYPDVGDNFTVDANGVETFDDVVAREYRGFSSIPCRADPVRAFRPDALPAQVTQVDEIDLQLPMDMVVEETDHVFINGFEYKIRQLINDSDWALTKVAKIMKLGVSLD